VGALGVAFRYRLAADRAFELDRFPIAFLRRFCMRDLFHGDFSAVEVDQRCLRDFFGERPEFGATCMTFALARRYQLAAERALEFDLVEGHAAARATRLVACHGLAAGSASENVYWEGLLAHDKWMQVPLLKGFPFCPDDAQSAHKRVFLLALFRFAFLRWLLLRRGRLLGRFRLGLSGGRSFGYLASRNYFGRLHEHCLTVAARLRGDGQLLPADRAVDHRFLERKVAARASGLVAPDHQPATWASNTSDCRLDLVYLGFDYRVNELVHVEACGAPLDALREFCQVDSAGGTRRRVSPDQATAEWALEKRSRAKLEAAARAFDVVGLHDPPALEAAQEDVLLPFSVHPNRKGAFII